jgi:leucyl aminopeptidase
MLTMKDDMAGAAVVLATMHVIAQLKPKVNVVAVAPLVENMPSGSAQKPGDVIKTYSGKTIEVIDTDAEGRLILADAIAYTIDKYKPAALIDVATLTGAIAYALGVFYAGMFTQHDPLAKRLIKASQRSGDQLWRLPLDDDYAPAIRSDIADVKNVGSQTYMGGSITAGLFLKEFVTPETPWVHLDIAGVAFGVPDLTYIRPGATGWGIKLLTDLAMNWEPLPDKVKKK